MRAKNANRHGQQGFTLVELLVVIAILGILISITLVATVTYRNRALAARVDQEVAAFQKASVLFYVDHSAYPNPASSGNADAACAGTVGGVYQKCCVSEGGCWYDGHLDRLEATPGGDFASAERAPRWLAALGETAYAILGGRLPSFLAEAPVSFDGGNGTYQGVFYDCVDAGCSDANVYYTVPTERCPRGEAHNGLAGFCQQNITASGATGSGGEICGNGTCAAGEECRRDCPSETRCDDGVDNDQDGSVDGSDADCQTPTEDCSTSTDEDGDGAGQCDDSDCFGGGYCWSETVNGASCEDSQNNDGNEGYDCGDSDCLFAGSPCYGGTETARGGSCEDGKDNDGDGATDAMDSDCGGIWCGNNVCDSGETCASCSGDCGACPSEICDNGVDDDQDGQADCLDWNDCGSWTGPSTYSSETRYSYRYCSAGSLQTSDVSNGAACYDDQDNDRNGCTDWPDYVCGGGESGACGDNVDNDCDGAKDCADGDCAANPACAPTEDCANSQDDDGDGQIDCSDPDCVANPICA